ncbi:hypothetical protein KCP73_23870 [Salmonella enterica subsp. enterica]|nr:hypothetical protein KCP73_23870 [Salmonella enterica subsp. enterica]
MTGTMQVLPDFCNTFCNHQTDIPFGDFGQSAFDGRYAVIAEYNSAGRWRIAD